MYHLRKTCKEAVCEEELIRVQNFDKEYKKVNDYEFVISRMLTYMFLFVGILLWLIPIQDDDAWPIAGVVIGLQLLASYWYIRPYLTSSCNKEVGIISIPKILSSTPVSRQAIIEVRMKYFRCYFLKVGSVIVILQQIGALICKEWAICNVAYPLAGIGIIYMFISTYIKRYCVL